MTYFLDIPMYPKEAMLEAISKGYLDINDRYGFTCISDTCDGCPVAANKGAFCDRASRYTELRKQVATIVKSEHPEYFI